MVRLFHLLIWSATAYASSGGRYTVNDTLRGRMPKTFGGWTAAEDAANDGARPCATCMGVAHYPTNEAFGVTFVTDPLALAPLLPAGLELLAPNVTVGLTLSHNVTWIGGRSYFQFGVSVPVRHTAPASNSSNATAAPPHVYSHVKFFLRHYTGDMTLVTRHGEAPVKHARRLLFVALHSKYV